jgi:GAF domain-containing protein
MRRLKTGGKVAKTQRPKTLKRHDAPKPILRRGSRATAKETDVARLTRELHEALEQQTATSEVLRVISSSPGELEPVFQAMLANAVRICDAKFGTLYRYDNEAFDPVALFGVTPELAEFHRQHGSFQPPAGTGLDRLLRTKDVVRMTDELAEPVQGPSARFGGARSLIAVPMLTGNVLIGAIIIYRQEVRPFTDKQIELVSNFAAQAVIAIENTRLLNELRESLQQQTATADVLKVISRSTFDLQTVLDTLTESAAQLCEADIANIWRPHGLVYRLAATHEAVKTEQKDYLGNLSLEPSRGSCVGRVLLEGGIVHIHDIQDDPDYALETAKLEGYRTMLGVPLLREGTPVGVIALVRAVRRPFTEKQIELATTFADQAVIAIENVRLFDEVQQRTRELSEALEQQTATSEVLKVISSSRGELEPVFNAMLANATRICEATFGRLWLFEGNAFRAVAIHSTQTFADYQLNPVLELRDHPGIPLDRIAKTKQVVHIPDFRADQSYIGKDSAVVTLVETEGTRSFVAVPMLKEGELIGAIAIYRQEVRPFTDKQIELVSNFAAQAVIAIENTRLLSELRESLQQQTATADVLKVISSSPGQLAPVFNSMLENATRICGAGFGSMFYFDGGRFDFAANYGTPPALVEFQKRRGPFLPPPGGVLERVLLTKQVAHSADYLAEQPQSPPVALGGARSTVAVPMLKDDQLVGGIVIYRKEVRPFSEKEIDLVKNFASQAVIAIENTRLLNELRESLQQQMATADVLKVISRSTFDLQTVLDTLLKSAARLCQADHSFIFLREGEVYRCASGSGDIPEWIEYLKQQTIRPGRGTVAARTALEGRTVHIPDVLDDPEYTFLEAQRRGGYRTALGVPLLREGIPIGVIVLTRPTVRPFDATHIALVTTFADQAVIAIENVRLFNETQEALQQQTATADVLKAISRSAFDLKTVLDALIEAAARLCEADQGTIARERDSVYQRVATYGYPNDFKEYVRTLPVIPERGTAVGRALLEGKVVHIPDVLADSEYTFAEGQKLGGFRTVLSVPMLREGIPIGVLSLTRPEVRPFTEKQIELVTTFADQAAIAIENARLFESVEARTRELAKSLEDLRSTQNRLVQTEKLASLGQLTAGIAHEIKNPLNFVNNFSGVSAELIDELQEALGDVSLNEKRRSEITELMDTLRGNLDKVVQHGKRADAIVKNMLLHSRAGSGEHRPVDINALVEESLSLAWHGARAEKQGFNITLERSFDPAAGEADVFPQEITRALLNLISNGFYAATKRKIEVNGGGYEPTLAATTKNLGDRVEIRIRDNGTGIPPEVRERLFTPFFTTKPAGEGTGLGLSISHDIIVKQHGGSIEVETEPGAFTEFTIILPRAALGQQ